MDEKYFFGYYWELNFYPNGPFSYYGQSQMFTLVHVKACSILCSYHLSIDRDRSDIITLSAHAQQG